MKKLKFKYLAAKNFLCYGPQGVEIDLESYGNIILVKGKNWDDINPNTGLPGSNGAGKSSLQEILVFTLYGKTIKKLKNQGRVVNKFTQGGLRTEVRWDDYRVVRRIDHKMHLSFERWDGKKWVDECLGAGAPETQKKIEAAIGLNLKSFTNILVFDYKSISFLDCELSVKREIVENLLSLDKYRIYNKVAKDLKKDSEKKVKELSDEYLQLNLQLDGFKKRVIQIDEQEASWKAQKKTVLATLMQRIKDLTSGMAVTDEGKALADYTAAQDEIASLLEQIPKIEADQEAATNLVAQLRTKLNELSINGQNAQSAHYFLREKKESLWKDMKALATDINKMNNAEPGVRCSQCFMEADPASFGTLVVEYQGKIDALETEINNDIVPKLQAKSQEIEKLNQMAKLVTSKMKDAEAKSNEHALVARKARARVSELQKIKKPEAAADALLIEQQINTLKGQAKDQMTELNGPSPFEKIRQSAVLDVEKKKTEYEQKKSEIQEAERLLPYYEYWVTAFGDSGIRKYVIDGIIQPLNERISFWLNYLIYGNISLKFDNELEETIHRVPSDDDDPFVYDQLSGGEQRRLNLSVPLSFAHCMELSSGSSPSVVFLDEVAVNIDENGIEGIYNMIRELATEKQVFVTDHNPLLLDLLQGQDTINLERRNKITKLVA